VAAMYKALPVNASAGIKE